ncbi:MFS general substrate transporter [Myriangium duriaei CBS 260.36]|uniref:Cercosporin MFS transporter CTB4 n=1 Tax=Myriangium duriaei CBS 260.36 TaxID=1168546 RepID=A0A9P4IXI6_9PEZI|nr:MFS general substrate transporter [Myriangium duriaei CBS 260.36]
MMDIFRESILGQVIRFATRNRVLRYAEEHADFQCPPAYRCQPSIATSGLNLLSNGTSLEQSLQSQHKFAISINDFAAEKQKDDIGTIIRSTTVPSGPLHAIIPTVSTSGIILVDWYGTDDPENPHNWSSPKKAFVALQICLYTFAVYMASAIYTPSELGVMQHFAVGPTAASLGLAIYVLGYGLGPLLFSPLSEIPVIGRNPPYSITFAIFVILCVPTALADNFAELIVLRFLQGFFGSPCLATGGATMGDMYSIMKLPYLFCFWVTAATCGPAFGPLISGFSVTAKDWRWSLWEILWLAGPIFLLLFACLPETSSATILLRRARRLRKLTGNDYLRSQSEIDQAKLSMSEIAIENLWRPTQILIQDPAILFASIYCALIYGIYYSFFEVFPLVYMDLYHFNVGEMGLTFLSISVGTALAITVYCSYIFFVLEPDIRKNGFGPQEDRLYPALYSAFLIPVGLFLFGWTANIHVHWMASVAGTGVYSFGVFILLQCMFLYVPLTYPKYAASLFAGNDFVRSAVACGAVLFARPLYMNLGIGKGVTLLACFTAASIGGIFALYFYGATLRAKSRFAVR